MFKCLQIMCAKYYELILKNIAPRQSWRVCLMRRQNCVIFGVWFKDEKLTKSKPR